MIIMQNYTFLFTSAGNNPANSTKKLSYLKFIEENSPTIRVLLLHILPNYPEGLSCRQISQLTNVEIQSLTNPLMTLVDEGNLIIVDVRRVGKGKRFVHCYAAPSSVNSGDDK